MGENEDGVGGVGGIYFAKFDCEADGKLAIEGGVAGMTGGLLGVALLGGAIGYYWVAWRLSDVAIKRVLGGVGGGECEIVVGMRMGCCWDENDALLRLAHPMLELGLGFGFPL